MSRLTDSQTRKMSVGGRFRPSLVISPMSRIVASVAAVVVAACIGDRQILRQMQSPNQSKHHTCMKKGCMAAKCRQTAHEVQSYVITDAIGRNQHAYALCLASFSCYTVFWAGPQGLCFVCLCFGPVQRACVLRFRVLGDLFGRPLPKHRDHIGRQGTGRRHQSALHAA